MSLRSRMEVSLFLLAAAALVETALAAPQSGIPLPGSSGAPNRLPGLSAQSGRRDTLFISGRVALEDGSPPPSIVAVEATCNGVQQAEAHTDQKGRFSIQLGNGHSQPPDDPAARSEDSNDEQQDENIRDETSGTSPAPFSFSGCELRAVLPGYASQSVNLSDRSDLDNANVGVIHLRRVGNAEGTVVSATSLAAPKAARKAYEKGINAARKRKLEDARKSLARAVEIYPAFAAAWCELGRVQAAQQQTTEARASFEAALAADARYLDPYLEMERILFGLKQWEQVADISARALRLDPYGYPMNYLYHAVAQFNLGRFDEAEKSARQAEKLDTRNSFPNVRRILGLILAARGDYAGAAVRMRAYVQLAPFADDAQGASGLAERYEKLAAAAQAATQTRTQ